MMNEILKEKTVLLGMLIYGEQGIIGGELEYKEFEAGNNLFGYSEICYPLGINGVKLEDYNEKYWIISLIEGVKVFLSLDDTFVDVKELLVDLTVIPSETLSGLSFYKPDNLEEALKEKITDKKFQNLKIRFM